MFGRAGLSAAALIFAFLALGAPPGLDGQETHRIPVSSGPDLEIERDSLMRLLAATRELRRDLEEDPSVLYYTGVGRPASADKPRSAFPWNAVEVLTDSTAAVETPGNLREADRAYYAYAVIRMRNVRSDPDVSCDSLVAREVAAVEGFVDGWLVARALFGAPSFAPLDALAAARQAGHLPALTVAAGNRQVEGCLRAWAGTHEDALEAYRAWRAEAFHREDA